MKPRWLGGPIEARDFDEIVDFMVATLTQQLCYQLRGRLEFLTGRPSSSEQSASVLVQVRGSGENLRGSCNFWRSAMPVGPDGRIFC